MSVLPIFLLCRDDQFDASFTSLAFFSYLAHLFLGIIGILGALVALALGLALEVLGRGTKLSVCVACAVPFVMRFAETF